MRDNTVFVGKKPIMNYVTACMTVLNQKTSQGRVTVAARGRTISKVVDIVEVLKKFIQFEVENIDIGTERVGYEGEERNVSTIEIHIHSPR